MAIDAFPQTGTTPTQVTARRSPSWRYGLATGVVAAAGTTVVAAVIRAAGVELGVDGEPIPLLGFAQFVLIGAVIGIVLARHSSRTTFIRATVVLTALSCVPSLAWGTAAADRIGLVATHLVAAAIIVPRYVRR